MSQSQRIVPLSFNLQAKQLKMESEATVPDLFDGAMIFARRKRPDLSYETESYSFDEMWTDVLAVMRADDTPKTFLDWCNRLADEWIALRPEFEVNEEQLFEVTRRALTEHCGWTSEEANAVTLGDVALFARETRRHAKVETPNQLAQHIIHNINMDVNKQRIVARMV